MATSISSLGVGSGLPLDTLLQQLRTAENAPLAMLKQRADKEQQRLSAYGTLKSALESVSKAAEALSKSETFHSVKATVTGETFSATTKAGSNTITGNYNITVDSLARAQVLASSGVNSRTESLASGTGKVDITFTLANGKERVLSIDANEASLENIVRAINNDTDLGVSATLMNDGGASPHRLMITADSTGTDSRITSISLQSGEGASGQDLTNLVSALAYDENEGEGPSFMSQIIDAKNASIKINGISVTSQSNTIEDAIDGVTLTLLKEAASAEASDTLSVARNDGVATAAATAFVNAYNTLQSTIRSLTAYDIDNQTSAALTGDGLARRAQAQVRDALGGLFSGSVSLSSIGIKTDPTTGNLSVDSDKLTKALETNRQQVEELFSGPNGLTSRITAAVESFTKSDGLIKTTQDGITRNLKFLEQQYEATEARIDQKMETYRLQFVQLDSFMAQMTSTSNYLTQQLSVLNNLGSGSNKS